MNKAKGQTTFIHSKNAVEIPLMNWNKTCVNKNQVNSRYETDDTVPYVEKKEVLN